MTDVSHAVPARAPTAAAAGLPKELTDFLVELSVAMHRRAMYPGGHPSLAAAEQRVIERAVPLLAAHSAIAVGVARDQLIVDGVATDGRHHLLRGLAHRLHGHRLAGFRLQAGIAVEEITGFLERLSRDPEDAAKEPLTVPGSSASRWPHINLYRQAYERLELADDDEHVGSGGHPSSRSTQLWLELAQAALASEGGDGGGGATATADTDPGEVAQAINTRSREAAYEQAVVGYLLQIAEQLRSSDSADTTVLRSRVSRLVRSLSPEALHRLLEMGGNLAQRRSFLVDASQGMATEAVLSLTVGAAEASQQAISRPLLRLLAKLASHSKRGPMALRSASDLAFREHVRELVDSWHLPDPASPGYHRVLDHLTSAAPSQPNAPAITQVCEVERTIEMCLDIRYAGPALWDAVQAMTARGDIARLLDMLDALAPDNPLPGVIRTRLATPENLARLLALPTVDPARVDDFVRRVGLPAADVLLDTLSASSSRATRRRLIELLTRLGDGIGPLAAARLPDAPWYMQRNLLLVMGGITSWPAEFSPLPYAKQPDARVRREALRLMVKRAHLREAAIAMAITDTDHQIIRLGLDAAQKQCPSTAVPGLVQRATDRAMPTELQVLAVRALGASGKPEALACILDVVTTRTRWLRRERLAAKSPTTLAALTVLAARGEAGPRAARVLAQALRSADAEIRAAAHRAA